MQHRWQAPHIAQRPRVPSTAGGAHLVVVRADGHVHRRRRGGHYQCKQRPHLVLLTRAAHGHREFVAKCAGLRNHWRREVSAPRRRRPAAARCGASPWLSIGERQSPAPPRRAAHPLAADGHDHHSPLAAGAVTSNFVTAHPIRAHQNAHSVADCRPGVVHNPAARSIERWGRLCRVFGGFAASDLRSRRPAGCSSPCRGVEAVLPG